MAKIPIFIVDAFTPKPFGGNPAAVCLLKEDIPDETKQKLAMEINLSETAFVLPLPDDDVTHQDEDVFKSGKKFSLRWFTPITEVPLCGHATLASAAVLFFVMGNSKELEFITRSSGTLTAVRRDDPESSSGSRLVEMRLPLNPATIRICQNSHPDIWHLVEVVLGDLKATEVWLSPTTKKLLIQLEDDSRDSIEALKIDKDAMVAIDTGNAVRGVIVTSKVREEYDFVSRYFAPWVGIPEDPVTGSAHTVLGPFWSAKLGRNHLFARQCSARGGELRLEVVEDEGLLVRGEAVVVLEGSVTI